MNFIYSLSVVLFLLDSLISFDIKSQIIKSYAYFGILFGTPLILIWNFFIIKTKSKRIIGTIIPTIIIFLIVIIGPMNILFTIGVWRTQKILFENKNISSNTIEFQMQDIGALGYNKRTVEVFSLTPFFIITKEVSKEIDKSVKWFKVDKEINELELKEP